MDERLVSFLDGRPASLAECALVLTRALWHTHSEGVCDVSLHSFPLRCTVELTKLQLDVREGLTGFQFPDDATAEGLAVAAISALEPEPGPDGRLTIDCRNFSVLHILGRIATAGWYPLADLTYHAFRRIRVHHGLWLNGLTLRTIRMLAAATNEYFEGIETTTHEAWQNSVLKRLVASVNERSVGAGGVDAKRWAQAFFDILVGAGVVQPTEGRRWTVARPLDPDRMISSVFGLPTSIDGFDALFNGGMLLLDSLPTQSPEGISSYEPQPQAPVIPGRTVLAIGPFGSGKSLLSLQIAVEVARKGGAAWVIAFEQTVEECKYALEAIGFPMDGQSFDVVHDIPDAAVSLLLPEGRGVIILRHPPKEPDPNTGDYLQPFLDRLQRRLPLLKQYPLRVMIIDPINSILEAGSRSRADLRTRLFAALETAKACGVNVWIACEQTEQRPIEGRFEENIADTVIRLSAQRDSIAPQRFIEVTKSRLQRERPGKHLFRITDTGTHVVPMIDEYPFETAAFREMPSSNIDIGVPGLTKVMGEDSVERGDVLALEGPTGTSKTLFAAQFLIGRDLPYGRSLFVSDFALPHMKAFIRRAFGSDSTLHQGEKKAESDVLYLPIRLGYVDPQEILASLHAMLEEQAHRGCPIDRAAVGNTSRWELGLPLLARDPTFGSSLVWLLRRYNVTTILLCGFASHLSDTPLKNLLLEQADCVLEFSTMRAGERFRQTVRAVKTRRMNHRSGRFQLDVTNDGLRVGNETLYREVSSGGTETVPVNLYLHSETLIHRNYNRQLAEGLRAVISPKTDVKRQSHRLETGLKEFARLSAIDEVQIVQLDEFQLPHRNRTAGGDAVLHEISAPESTMLLANRLDELAARVQFSGPGGRRCFAIPFYVNISLLAYQNAALPDFPKTWENLASECARWEVDHPNTNEIFFGCQVEHANRFESFNCLFLEILSSLSPFWRKEPANSVTIATWLETAAAERDQQESLLGKALRIFRTLVKRCHDLVFQYNLDSYKRADRNEDDWEKAQFEVNRRAIVWRQWYNTLNQLLADFSATEQSSIQVVPLYGSQFQPEDYLTSAGEWYLAVPVYSASPELAVEIIKYLTTTDQEMQRLGLGIGLPTQKEFYDRPTKDSCWGSLSPYFEMDMAQIYRLVTEPSRMIRRSHFAEYAEQSGILSSHLLRILQMPGPHLTYDQMEHIIKSMLGALRLAVSGGPQSSPN